MLCQRCRRVAVTAARQVSRQSRMGLSTKSPPAITLGARLAPRQSALPKHSGLLRVSPSLQYSTFSESAASSSATPPGPEKPDYLDDSESAIWDKLVTEFAPTELMVQDVSGGCGSMYGIEIASEKFRGTNMLKQQRMVNAVLGEEMKEWHGVQLRTKVPA